jgi:hypothetical protein
MDINSIALSLSTRKLNSPKTISKPPVLAEVGFVEPQTDPMTAVTAGSTTSPEAIVGSTPSMLLMGEALLMMVSMMVSMADGSLSMVDGALSMAMVGEGADESVDPDPVIPTVGAN